MKKTLTALLAVAMILCFTAQAALAAPEGYTLRQVTILSRHNLRAPLSSNGSVPEELTLANPPMRYALSFEGIERNADGLFAEADLLGLFEKAMAAFDDLDDVYGMNAAA